MARAWGRIAGALAGGLLAVGAVGLWWQSDPALVGVALAARASADPAQETLVEGTLIPDREGPLVISPATETGAIAYELVFYTPSSHHPQATLTQVYRVFGGLPMVIRVGARRYQLKGEVSRVFDLHPLTVKVDAPQRWFPVRLRQTYAGRPFTIQESALEPAEKVAVRGRLEGTAIVPLSGALEIWSGGLAPFQQERDQRRGWAYAAGAAALFCFGWVWWTRPRPEEPWKAFR